MIIGRILLGIPSSFPYIVHTANASDKSSNIQCTVVNTCISEM